MAAGWHLEEMPVRLGSEVCGQANMEMPLQAEAERSHGQKSWMASRVLT